MSRVYAKPERSVVDKARGGKVKRYWPGKAPEWYQQEHEEEEEEERPLELSDDEDAGPLARTDVAAPVIVHKADDPRLARLAQQAAVGRRRRAGSSDEEDEEAGGGVVAPQVVRRGRLQDSEEEEAEEEEEEEDEELLEARRAVVRAKLARQQQEEVLAGAEEEEEEEEDESSEYETDSEEEGGRTLMKPVFVPKTERETVAEREALEAEDEAAAAAAAARLQQRKAETREIVGEILQAEAAAAAANGAAERNAIGSIVTDDEEGDEDAEFEAWKRREMRRIARDREVREREQKEHLERERWRAMSEEERARELARLPKEGEQPKKKWRFLQKYWHKGAFFQDADDAPVATTGRLDVLDRDYSAPVGEDKLDRSILPEVMQVKNFGRRGRTKWTHLVDQDTTNFETPWMQNDALRAKYNSKMAGMNGELSKPKHLKR